jgi:hypothetical protein
MTQIPLTLGRLDIIYNPSIDGSPKKERMKGDVRKHYNNG